MVKFERVGNILDLVECGYPKKITLELSEDGTFYTTKIYTNVVDKNKNKEYEGYFECKSKPYPDFIKDSPLVCDPEDEDATIFTLTIPGIDE
jgi:hypothetical protein